MKQVPIRFLKGRVRFELGGESKDSAPFPSAIIVYKGANKEDVR